MDQDPGRPQAISSTTLEALVHIALLAQQHLTDPNRPQANVTQWAKQQFCWEGFKRVHIKLDDAVEGDLTTAAQAQVQAVNRPDFRSVLQARMEDDEQEVFAGDA